MRNPRIDPQKGDVLEHVSGELRAVLMRGDDSVQFSDPFRHMVSQCSADEWREWAVQTSILGLAEAPNQKISA